MKRLVVCCDGTWSSEDDCGRSGDVDRGNSCRATNVWRIAQLVQPRDGEGHEQRVFYQPGVGSAPTRNWLKRAINRLGGGAFGWGLDENISEAYRWLIREYEPGDELWLFGFSRGAYTARSLAGLLRNCGLLRKVHEDRIDQAMQLYRSRRRQERPDAPHAHSFRMRYAHHWETTIKFIGVWDTVGSRRLPASMGGLARLWNRRYEFHDCVLSRQVENAYHALAIDERRKSFEPALWEWDEHKLPYRRRVRQVWFAGSHSDVGGGYADRGLSDVTLQWMISRARLHGLAFYEGAVEKVQDDVFATLHDSRRLVHYLPRLTQLRSIDERYQQFVHRSARERMQAEWLDYKPKNLPADMPVVDDAAMDEVRPPTRVLMTVM